jgi:putative transposase
MYTNEKREMMLRQHQGGKTVKEICEEHHVSKSSLYNWIRQDGPVNSRRKTHVTCRMYYELEQEVLRLREEVEILHRAGCSRQTPSEQRLPELVRLNSEYGYSVHALCRALEVRRSEFYHYTCYADRSRPYFNAIPSS